MPVREGRLDHIRKDVRLHKGITIGFLLHKHAQLHAFATVALAGSICGRVRGVRDPSGRYALHRFRGAMASPDRGPQPTCSFVASVVVAARGPIVGVVTCGGFRKFRQMPEHSQAGTSPSRNICTSPNAVLCPCRSESMRESSFVRLSRRRYLLTVVPPASLAHRCRKFPSVAIITWIRSVRHTEAARKELKSERLSRRLLGPRVSSVEVCMSRHPESSPETNASVHLGGDSGCAYS